jgi:hypothetical protein
MNSKTRISLKKDQILYKKVNGKYVPVTDPWAMEGLREGWWLVKVTPSSHTIRAAVYPDKAELVAAAKDMEEKLMDIIRDASKARPSKSFLNPDEKRDWDWFVKKHGESFNALHYPSFAENAEKIMDVLLDKTSYKNK